MKTRRYVRCPCCGSASALRRFTHGALGQYQPMALTQSFVTKGQGRRADGSQGGAIIWDRSPATRDELEYVARAVAAGSDNVIAQLGEDLVAESPESVLANIYDDAEAEAVGDEWLRDAADEVERRARIVDEDRQRRRSR